MAKLLLEKGDHFPHLLLPIARTKHLVGLYLLKASEESACLVEGYLVDFLYRFEDLVAADQNATFDC